MAEIKIYKVSGFYRKNKRKIPLTMEVRATKESEVLEKVFAEIGSRHRAKRSEIYIPKEGGIQVIEDETNVRNPIFKDIDAEDFFIP